MSNGNYKITIPWVITEEIRELLDASPNTELYERYNKTIPGSPAIWNPRWVASLYFGKGYPSIVLNDSEISYIRKLLEKNVERYSFKQSYKIKAKRLMATFEEAIRNKQTVKIENIKGYDYLSEAKQKSTSRKTSQSSKKATTTSMKGLRRKTTSRR